MNLSAEQRAILQTIEARNQITCTSGRNVQEIGPFLAVAHATDPLEWLSYVIPLSNHPPFQNIDFPTVLRELRRWFQNQNRKLRFEILEPLWPELSQILLKNGLQMQARMPLMLCAAEQLRRAGVPVGCTLQAIDSDCDDRTLAEFLTASRIGFGDESFVPSQEHVLRFRQSLAGNEFRALAAMVDGKIVSVGQMTVQNDELVGITTLKAYRGRGLASAVSSSLLAQHFSLGHAFAWLSAGDSLAQSVYSRIGFTIVGDQVNLQDAPPTDH